ncbi:Hypothetical predicted protein [Cloeon dipterum]|uniref:Spermatogenesis-associated protein 6 N-terminal domain-containing protein n=1 Tax=Cloeon dipterum TaxID=197152 RepID=A0A8S1C8N8_9INSE|nr:Hypothetical predicted protein [Cloeon dipterum]
MSHQHLKVNVRLQVLKVNSPGMCRAGGKGDLLLHLWIMDRTYRTASLPASFPLHFNQTFNISKVYDATDLFSLHSRLASEFIRLELQESAPGLRSIAIFKSALVSLLFPESGSLSSAPITTLQMQPLCHFPGLLGPDIEVSTRVCIQQVTEPSPHSFCMPLKKIPSVAISPCRQVKFGNRCSKLSCLDCVHNKTHKPPFVVRHVDSDILHYSKTPSPCKIRNKRSTYQSELSSGAEDFHPEILSDCKCSVCRLYEQYFGKSYPQHCGNDDDEGFADLTQSSECCCYFRHNSA